MAIFRGLNGEVPVDICDHTLRGFLDLYGSSGDLFSLIIYDLALYLDLLSERRECKGHEGKTEGDKA